MAKIDKTDIENIQLISKETKLQNITSVRIKKGNYEIEISSLSNSTKQEFIELHENKAKQQKTKIIGFFRVTQKYLIWMGTSMRIKRLLGQ